jgi:hypothetical protein
MTAIEPDYVQAVRREMADVRFREVRLSEHPLPPPASPILVCVLRNEADRLPDMLRHYREGGIRRFCFIDNGSTDGSVAFLAAQPDVDLLERRGRFEWRLKQGWINSAIARYGAGRWILCADADEHVVFEGFGRRGFPDLAAEMDRRGIRRVRGVLLDMYGPGALLRSHYPPGGRLLDSYPHYDAAGYDEQRFREIVSVKGGPRRRAFSAVDPAFNPELTKYPLFRPEPGEIMANPHHVWPYEGNFASPRHLAILHFKFLPNITSRIRTALAEGSYWDGSSEYRAYHEAFRRDPELSLHGPGSRRFTSAEQLVAEGLIAPVGWPRSADEADALRQAARRHRAQLGAAGRLPGTTPVPPQAAAGEAPAPVAAAALAPAAAAATPAPAAPAAAEALQPVVREYRTKPPNYRHADVVIPALPLSGGRAAPVRFKLGIKGVAPRLEFRRGADWPLFAGGWPGAEEDAFGPVFRVGPAGPRQRYMQQIPDLSDREALAAIIDRMPDIVAAILPQLNLQPEEAILFLRAARELPAALA